MMCRCVVEELESKVLVKDDDMCSVGCEWSDGDTCKFFGRKYEQHPDWMNGLPKDRFK